MIDIKKFDRYKNVIKELKEVSEDDSDKTNIQYMTESSLEVIDFDEVKKQYHSNLKLVHDSPKSFDCFTLFNENQVFIEFKNGIIEDKEKRREIKEKSYCSLLMFCDITDKTLSYMRKNIDFILVYNKEKNSKEFIKQHYASKAGQELILFSLQGLKTLYFKNVHTYTQDQFEKYLEKMQA